MWRRERRMKRAKVVMRMRMMMRWKRGNLFERLIHNLDLANQ